MTSRPAIGLTPVAQSAAPVAQAAEASRDGTAAPAVTTAGPVALEPAAPGPAASGPATRGSDTPGPSATPGRGAIANDRPGDLGGTSPTDVDGTPTSDADPALGPAGPLAGDAAPERHRLAPRVKRYWRWRAFFSAVPLLVLLISLAIVIPWGPPWVRWGIVGIAAAAVVIGMVVLPPIRYRVFWYAISETEIDIQHKIIFVERSVIPMHRVQSLQTERGPLADHYRMTNLKIKTAAGSVSISGLDRDEANALCDRISKLADIADDV